MAELFVGEHVDPASHQRSGRQLQLASADFTTHGVIVGMTGSGKTGLALVLVEEALRAGIPVLMIDPKGDLGNLLLTFPELRPGDFRPWIDEAAAVKAGVSADEFAAQQAERWTSGLASWGLDGTAIADLRAGVRFTIHTPGSTAGVPLNIVGALQAPDTTDDEAVGDEVDGYVSGLLGLVGIDADPLASREHILLANLIGAAWRAGRDLDLPTLVAQVAAPPLRKLGVFELDQFFPPDARMALAMKLNGLLASPSFAAWAQGPALDVDTLLFPGGSPGATIVYTAHLSDVERQFVTALILGKVVTWMRRQPGTSGLRALVYMDEVAGYVPPVATPPTKGPIMTLMKQGRAFGVGTVLATQNPVDLDYKALSNAGTWMVGRLQTERDKSRLLDGLSSAAGGVDLTAVGNTITGLAPREFVLRRAGVDEPEVFTSRWAMSYLRGPLTTNEIGVLTADAPERAAQPGASSAPAAAEAPPGQGSAVDARPIEGSPPSALPTVAGSAPAGADESPVPPVVAAGTPVHHLDPAAALAERVGAVPGGTRLAAAAIARVRLLYDETAADLRHTEEWEAVLYPLTASPDPAAALAVDYDDRDLRAEAPAAARYAIPGAPIADRGFWAGLKKALVDELMASRTVEVQRNLALKLWSRVGETEASFANRCAEAADFAADAAAAKLRTKYETRIRRARRTLASAEDRAAIAETEAQGRRTEELMSTAGGLLDTFLGGRRGSRARARTVLGRLGGTAGRRTRSSAGGQRADAARNRATEAIEELEALEADLAAELVAIEDAWRTKADAVETVRVGLERTDVSVATLGLVWIPT